MGVFNAKDNMIPSDESNLIDKITSDKQVNTQIVNTNNFDGLPVFAMNKLPSKWLAYPKNATIDYRVYNFGEIKTYNQSKLDTIGELNFVLKGIRGSFDLLTLTLSDFLYIGFLRKMSTLGTIEFTTTFICNECESENNIKFISADLEFKDLSMDKLPIVVDLAIGQLQFMPLTVKKYIELVNKDEQDDEIKIFAKQCINKSYDEAYKLIYNLSSDEIELMEEVDKLLYHGLEPLVRSCKNDSCKAENNIEVDKGGHLIYPFRQREESHERRIHFGT